MPRPMSRAQRRAAFLDAAAHLFDELDTWYEQHPDATFEELEAQARPQRRVLMGSTLALLINGRDCGMQLDPPACPACGVPVEFEGYRQRTVIGLEGDTRLERAYYTCPRCTKQTLFPLDAKLHLRHDHWSEGAARVAAREGLQAPSFALAAEAFRDAVGACTCGESVRRVTEGWGRQREAGRA